MGGNILKTALNSMTLTAIEKVEIHGDRIETTAKERVIEQGGDGGLDVKLGFYTPPVKEDK